MIGMICEYLSLGVVTLLMLGVSYTFLEEGVRQQNVITILLSPVTLIIWFSMLLLLARKEEEAKGR